MMLRQEIQSDIKNTGSEDISVNDRFSLLQHKILKDLEFCLYCCGVLQCSEFFAYGPLALFGEAFGFVSVHTQNPPSHVNSSKIIVLKV
jgi:hypothetical protein